MMLTLRSAVAAAVARSLTRSFGADCATTTRRPNWRAGCFCDGLELKQGAALPLVDASAMAALSY